MMAKIREDFLGLYVMAGGYVCRPLIPSQFEEGDNPKTIHFGGSRVAGVGKDDSCARGEYVEYWIAQSMMLSDYRDMEKSQSEERFQSWVQGLYEMSKTAKHELFLRSGDRKYLNHD